MAVNPGGRRLRQWLIEQIHSNHYPGLLWEDEERTMFRIPWKHAGKQDYNQEVDASIFKAWAVFKGKHKEGDKAEPATWKTRLRCALNKSPDFEEVAERSQLDISEPYKVYRIVPEEEQKTGKGMAALNGGDVTDMECSSAVLGEFLKKSPSEDYQPILRRSHSPPEDTCRSQSSQEWWSQGSLNSMLLSPDPTPPGSFNSAFSQMMITFFYGGKLMGSTVTSHAEGCRVTPSQPPGGVSEALYTPDRLQSVRFPPAEMIEHERQRHVTRKLFSHLERGVLLRANREGVFVKRLCQSRVFWSGLCGAQYGPAPTKLERDAVVKIFDTGRFLQALQLYQEGQYQIPDPTVTLCFGEEFHDISTAKNKLIIVQITAVHCQQLLEAASAARPPYSGSGSGLAMADEAQNEQVARIFQDLCSYNATQRSFRDNIPITV